MPVKSYWVAVVKNSSKIIRGEEASDWQSYQLNDITDGSKPHPKPKSRQPQLTAANLAEIQEQARKEAFELGKKAGFEFGHKEAIEQYRSQFEEKLHALDVIMNAFQKPFTELDDQVEKEVVELVISMVRQLVRREVKMDPSHIVGVAREALSVLPVSNRDVTLVLNPADAEIVREAFSLVEKEQGWKIIEDPVLNRGGCKVFSDTSQVDATLESRLDALIAPLISDERNQNPDDES